MKSIKQKTKCATARVRDIFKAILEAISIFLKWMISARTGNEAMIKTVILVISFAIVGVALMVLFGAMQLWLYEVLPAWAGFVMGEALLIIGIALLAGIYVRHRFIIKYGTEEEDDSEEDAEPCETCCQCKGGTVGKCTKDE